MRANGSIGVLALLGVFMAGCAGNGQGLDANGRPADSGTSGTALTADYDSIQSQVFTPICTVCHAGGSAPQGLRLDAGNAYTLLVDIASTEVPSTLRVSPGKPDSSYLIQKLEGHAAVGAQMPFGGPPLPGSTIAVIRQWITDGAARGVVPAATAPLAIDAVVPEPGEVLPAPPQIALSFNRELDATRVAGGSLRLERARGADDMTGAAGEGRSWVNVAARVTLSASARVLVLTPMAALEPGRYRVVPALLAGFALADLEGNELALEPALESGADASLTWFDVMGEP